MTAKDLRSPLLDALEKAASSIDLPVARIRTDATVGRVVLPADKKRRVVLDVAGIRRVVFVGKIDLLCPGRVVLVDGERGVITAIKIKGDDIQIEALYGTVLMSSSANDIEGMPR